MTLPSKEKLWVETAMTTAVQMFKQRGYAIKQRDKRFLRATKEDDVHVELYILDNTKLNVDVIKQYYSLLQSRKIQHGILVHQMSITSTVKQLLANMSTHIELFSIDELQYNVTKHRLVPDHSRVRRSKKNVDNYPIIKKTDPVCRFLGFATGDILLIKRRNGTIYYRFVR